jgi:EAL and modified HD-GYP domain-containing signal transduction protein
MDFMTEQITLQQRKDEAAQQGSATEMRSVARQPILDVDGRVHGYELLFRNFLDMSPGSDGDLAARTLLDDAVIFGLERYTGGLPAFVNCTAESLAEQLVNVLPPALTVLGIPETLEATPTLIETCSVLKASGFRLAVNASSWKPERLLLNNLANYIRVDFARTSAAVRQELWQHRENLHAGMLAQKVESQLDFQMAKAEGFTLFQGFYFCRPELLSNRKVPTNRLFHFEILQQLYREQVDMKKLAQLVMRDAALTYRLLRFVNSPLYAVRQEVRSIESALLLVGADAFRRIATLAILSEQNSGQAPEVLNMAFVRALFCELAANQCALDPSEQYLLGLFSLLPAMLLVPMEELVPHLPLRDAIRRALLGSAVPERCLLHWLECHEQGDWAARDAVIESNGLLERGLNEPQLELCYAAAVAGAEVSMRSATGSV